MSSMSSKIAFAGGFTVAALSAAALGGYVALRHNAADLPAQAPPASIQAAPIDPAPLADPAAVPASPGQPSQAAVPVPMPRLTTTPAPVAAPQTASAPATPAPPPMVAPSPALPVVEPAPVTPPAAAAETQAPAASPAPPVRYDQLTVAADAVLGLRLDSTLSSETARLEDKVHARLSRDVLVDGRVAVAAGAKLEGTITSVERGGKFKDRPRIGFTFYTLILADNTRVAIHTETIFREGDSPTGQANAKIGGSGVVGAILGSLIGGKKGAIVGSAMGAAGGAAAVAAGDRQEVVVTAGTPLTVRLTQPVAILIEREHE